MSNNQDKQLLEIPRIKNPELLLEYFITENGEVLTWRFDKQRKKDRMKEVTKQRSNKKDKKWGVRLATKNYESKFFYVHILMLETYKGKRGYEFKPHFKDGNYDNIHINNLEWSVRDNIEVSDLMEKYNVFDIYKSKLEELKAEEVDKFHDKIRKECIKYSHYLAEPDKRKKFFSLKILV